MSHPIEQPAQNAEDPQPKKPRSTWVVAGIVVVFLFGAIAGGLAGLGAWLFFVGILLLLTGGYALVARRQSWARLRNPKLRKTALAVGAGALILGGTFIALGAPALPEVAVDETAEVSDTPTPTPSPSPSASEESIADQACTSEATFRTQGETDFLCTLDNDGKLVWMEKDTSEQLTEARKAAAEQAAAEAAAQAEADRRAAEAEAARLAEQQAEADRQAAAEAQRQAEEAAAAAEAQRLAQEAAAAAEAQRQAEAAAAAAEAQRLAEEAEAQRLAEQQQPVPNNPGMVTYANCDAVRAAGADPIYPGQPGWDPKLDRNNNGVGCEP